MNSPAKNSHPKPPEVVFSQKNNEITPKIRPEIQYEWSFQRRPACKTLSKALDISIATAPVAVNLSEALAILSDSAVKREVLKLP